MHTDDIENRFAYHPPKDANRVSEHEIVRGTFKTIAHYLNGLLPEGREKSLVITSLEEAMFWANAAIARQSE